MLFQSAYVNSLHTTGQYHAYAAAANGQRFLIPQFESPAALYTAGSAARGRGATLTAILPAITADRHSSASPAGTSATPLMVVLNWTSSLKQK